MRLGTSWLSHFVWANALEFRTGEELLMTCNGTQNSGLVIAQVWLPLLFHRRCLTWSCLMKTSGGSFLVSGPLINVLVLSFDTKGAKASHSLACMIESRWYYLLFSTVREYPKSFIFLNLLEHFFLLDPLATKYSFINLFAI